MSSRNLKEKPVCPVHNIDMLLMYGCGWDYDRWICPIRGCDYEIELETNTFPEEIDDSCRT